MKVVDTWCILLDFNESIASITPFNRKCSSDSNMFCQYFLSVVFCFCLNNDIFEIYVWWIFNHLKCYVACIFQCIVSICSVHVRLGITYMWTYKFTFGSEQLVCPELSSNHFEYHCQIYLFRSFSVLEYHYDLSGFTISVVNFLCIIGNKYYSYFILVLYLFSIHFCLHLLFLKQYCHPLLTHCHPAMHICSSQQHPLDTSFPLNWSQAIV